MPAGTTQARLRKLTDSSGGTASTTDTIVALTGSYVEATMEAHAATFARKINQIIDWVSRK
jgi:hypothetical protein